MNNGTIITRTRSEQFFLVALSFDINNIPQLLLPISSLQLKT